MRAPEPVVLAGHGVVLEPLSPEHAADLLTAAQDDELWRWLPARRPRTEQDVLRLIRAHPADLAFAVVVDGRAQGSTSYLAADPAVGGIEVGWTWYARPLWATSVNPACKLLLLGHAFDELGAGRVTLKTDALNTRSRAAVARLGAHHDGTLRHDRLRPDGSVRDSVYFSVLAAEWPRVRAGLHARLVQTAPEPLTR